jgi:LytS/YehU family sensor histidine kinase
LIGSQPKDARKMIQQLSDFLRSTLKKDDQEWVTLEEEIQQLALYLEIEKMRFGHRLATSIHYEEETGQLKLPPMLLQPIVENAIKFGLYDTTEAVTIKINADANNNLLVITVQNPFDPQTTPPRKGTGFGLSGLQRRLYLLFARHDLLQTQSNHNNLFTTTLKIPQA